MLPAAHLHQIVDRAGAAARNLIAPTIGDA